MVKQSATGAAAAREGRGRVKSANASSNHWKGLLRRPPREVVALDAQAFVDELNRRWQADAGWRDDTRFVVAAGGHGGPTPTWEGPEAMRPAIARIVKSVVGEFESQRPFLFDR